MLTNFGISRHFPQDLSSETNYPQDFTRKYADPETMNQNFTGNPSDVFSLGCVFLEMASLLIGNDLPRSFKIYDTAAKNAYYCNLRKLNSWIDDLQKSAEGSLLIQSHHIFLNLHPTADSSVTDALIPVRRMLKVQPQARPPSRGLWENFRFISSEVCPDCDPRHPQVRRRAGLDNDENESEVSSVVSIDAPSMFSQSTLSSYSSIPELQGAAEEDLSVEATTDLERIAVKFARRHAQSIASHLCTSLDQSRNARYMEMHLHTAQVSQNEERIEQFLQQVANSGARSDVPEVEIFEPKDEHSDDGGSDEANRPGLSNLSNVKAFMTESKAFAGLREKFRAFVAPVSEEDHEPMDRELTKEHLEPVARSDDFKETTETREQHLVDQELTRESLEPVRNSDDSRETTETSSTTTDSSETQTSNVSIAFKEPINAPWYSRDCDLLKKMVSLAAEFLGVRETPLGYGMERVRWTCVILLTGTSIRPDR